MIYSPKGGGPGLLQYLCFVKFSRDPGSFYLLLLYLWILLSSTQSKLSCHQICIRSHRSEEGKKRDSFKDTIWERCGAYYLRSHPTGQNSVTWCHQTERVAGKCHLYSSGHLSPAKILLQRKKGGMAIEEQLAMTVIVSSNLRLKKEEKPHLKRSPSYLPINTNWTLMSMLSRFPDSASDWGWGRRGDF